MSLTQVQAVFGKYRLIAELGQGGMANVYLAIVSGPAGFNKLQVIKQLRSHLAEAPEFLEMFLDEARLAARLNHPNVVQTNEVGEHDGQYFIAMEYLDGQPLDRVLRRAQATGGLAQLTYMRILVEVLSGLHHAHELTDYDGTPLDVVHRDVTPHNVFITYEGQIKLVDFGIAKAANGSAETRTGVLKGKIAYMSPEQARGEPIDRRTDIFAVGLMLFEAVSGERPWTGKNDIYILNRLGSLGVPKIRAIKPDVDPELEKILDRALAFDRNDRHPTAAAFQGELERYLEARAARVSPRDIGKFVSEQFEDKRREIKSVLDAHLRDFRANTGSDPSLPAGSNEGPELRPALVKLPSLASSGDGTPLSVRSHRSSIADASPSEGLARQSHLTSPALVTSSDPHRVVPPGSRSTWTIVLLSGTGVLLLAGGALAYLDSHKLPPVPLAPASASTPTPAVSVDAPVTLASAAPSAPDTTAPIDIRIRVTPPDAHATLDGAPLPAGPIALKSPRDGSTHKLHIESLGYLSRNETLVYSAPIDLDLTLDKMAEGHGLVHGTIPTPPTATPTQKPRVTLDKDDPWAK